MQRRNNRADTTELESRPRQKGETAPSGPRRGRAAQTGRTLPTHPRR